MSVCSVSLIFFPTSRTSFGAVLLFEGHFARAELLSLIAIPLALVGVVRAQTRWGFAATSITLGWASALWWWHPYRW